MLTREPRQPLTRLRPGGDARAGRLHAEQPAAGGRNADRSAPVRRMPHRQHAGGDRGSRTATRAAGGIVGVPWIPRRPEQVRLGDRLQPEFRRVRLADDDQPGLSASCHHLAFECRNVVGEQLRGECRRHAGHRHDKFLEDVGNAGERTVGQPAIDRLAGLVVCRCHNGVERGIVRIDTLDRGFKHFERRHVALAHQIGYRKSVEPFVFLDHRASPLIAATPPSAWVRRHRYRGRCRCRSPGSRAIRSR